MRLTEGLVAASRSGQELLVDVRGVHLKGRGAHHVTPGERLGRLRCGPALVRRCERACPREKELGAQRASEGEKGQTATNLKATRNNQTERATERRTSRAPRRTLSDLR